MYVALRRLKWGDRFIEIGEPVPEDEPGRNYNALLFSHSIAGEPEPTAAGSREEMSVEPEEPTDIGSAPVDATEAAIRLAEENDVDPSEVTGTGKGGRILEADVQSAIDARTAE